jgi:hypothetical protein
MRRNTLVEQVWHLLRREPHVLRKQVRDAVARERMPARVAEHGSRGRDVGGDEVCQSAGCLGPQRADPLLVALAVNAHVSWPKGPAVNICRCERERLADARTGVVEEDEEDVVTEARRRAALGLGEDCTYLLGLEVRDGAPTRLLRADGEDALVLLRAREVVPEKRLDESSDGGEPAVARAGAIAARRFEIVEKGEHALDRDVIEPEVRDRTASAPCEEEKEEAQGIAVRSHGVWAGSSHAAQVLVDVRLDEREERVCAAPHGRPPRAERRRLMRLAARPSKRGVAVRYVSVPRILSCPM